jgi:hypothetical protein
LLMGRRTRTNQYKLRSISNDSCWDWDKTSARCSATRLRTYVSIQKRCKVCKPTPARVNLNCTTFTVRKARTSIKSFQVNSLCRSMKINILNLVTISIFVVGMKRVAVGCVPAYVCRGMGD